MKIVLTVAVKLDISFCGENYNWENLSHHLKLILQQI